jgi:hypothetical protein
MKSRKAIYVFLTFFLVSATSVPYSEATATATPVLGVDYSYTDIAVGSTYSCGLTNQNRVACWGTFAFGTESELSGWLSPGMNLSETLYEPTLISDLQNVTQIASHSEDICFLIDDGSIDCRGLSSYIFSPVDIHNAQEISTGSAGGCAISKVEQILCWDSNIKKVVKIKGVVSPKQLADKSSLRNGCILEKSKKVKCWSFENLERKNLGIKALPAAPGKKFRHTSLFCGVETSGNLYCWSGGVDNFNFTTQGEFNKVFYPVWSGTFCALDSSNRVFCWGRNELGQLGNGAGEASDLPILNESVGEVSDIDVSWSHGCALDTSGEITCWGSNGYAQLGDKSGNAYVIPPNDYEIPKFKAGRKPTAVNRILYFRGGVAWSTQKSLHWSGSTSYQTPITEFKIRWVALNKKWSTWKSTDKRPFIILSKDLHFSKVQVKVSNKFGTTQSKVFKVTWAKSIDLVAIN